MRGLLCKEVETPRFCLASKMEKGWEGLGLGWGVSLVLRKGVQGRPGPRRGGWKGFPEV